MHLQSVKYEFIARNFLESFSLACLAAKRCKELQFRITHLHKLYNVLELISVPILDVPFKPTSSLRR